MATFTKRLVAGLVFTQAGDSEWWHASIRKSFAEEVYFRLDVKLKDGAWTFEVSTKYGRMPAPHSYPKMEQAASAAIEFAEGWWEASKGR